MVKWTIASLKQWIDENIVKKLARLHQWAFGNGTGGPGAERRLQTLEEAMKWGNCPIGDQFKAHIQEHKEVKQEAFSKEELEEMKRGNRIAVIAVITSSVVTSTFSVVFHLIS
jgi:hypothetical protein